MKKESFLKVIIRVVVMAFAWETVYYLAFLQYTIYDPLLEKFGCTNAQLGLLLTIYGLFNVFGAPVGGWLCDRFDCRKIYVASNVVCGLVTVPLIFNSSYSVALLVWAGLGVGSLMLNYPSHIKILHALANKDNAGRYFGFNEAAIGIAGVVISSAGLFIFNRAANAVAGIDGVIILSAVQCFVAAVLSWFVVRDVKIEKENEPTEKMTAKDYLAVAKDPRTWLLGLGIFTVYCASCTMTYFTPYYTAAFGGTVVIAGVLAVIRSHGLKLIGGPVGGGLADKLKSPSKVLIIVNTAVIIGFTTVMFLGASAVPVFIFLVFAIGFVAFMGKGCYYSVSEELDIPTERSASAVGLACALGFSPDIFIFVLIGHWIDTYGVNGYRYVFIFTIVLAVIGIIGNLAALRMKKKYQTAAQN